ncbi:MAG: CPBP family intramembrane metalloprotease [Lachnospiraceae bacterium]|nr:CPBP family intramembrane metalloprotease [Lachnospiraceae bacterium]
MTSKRVNWGYLFLIAMVVAINYIPGLPQWIAGKGLLFNILISEVLVLLPMLLITISSGEKLSNLFPFKKIRFTTVLLIVLFTILLFPFTAFLNSFSMLFTQNQILQVSDEIVGNAPMVVLFFFALLAPFCEEVVFRGIVFGTYRKGGNILTAILLSALMFGFMHMNINQAIYAFALGIFMALLVEATGSLWSSLLVHAFFNGTSMMTLFASSSALGDASLQESASQALSSGDTLITIIITYGVIALITMTINVFVLRKIAKNEGNEGIFTRIWESRKEKGHLITIPLLVALALAICFMVATSLIIG